MSSSHEFTSTPAPPFASETSSFFSIQSITSLTTFQKCLLLGLLVFFLLVNISFFRLADILSRSSRTSNPTRRSSPPSTRAAHLLIILGSGGHTAELLNILSTTLPLLQPPYNFTHRTYVVSSGDSFSAQKAREFEASLAPRRPAGDATSSYDIVMVHRARKIHQRLLTTPLSSLRCLWDCIQVLRGSHADFLPRARRVGYPDLILTNGPGTGVIMILASIALLFFGFGGNHGASSETSHSTADAGRDGVVGGQMRSIYIESWARVRTLSLSGRLLKPLVNRFLVQWPQLAKQEGERVEYIGPLVT